MRSLSTDESAQFMKDNQSEARKLTHCSTQVWSHFPQDIKIAEQGHGFHTRPRTMS